MSGENFSNENRCEDSDANLPESITVDYPITVDAS